MNEVDKRIAVEVMGEPRPSIAQVTPALQSGGGYSPEGGWRTTPIGTWLPQPFSSDIDQAMRAWGKFQKRWKETYPSSVIELVIRHAPEWDEPFVAQTSFPGMYPSGYGQTLLEAICNLLLALMDEDD